MTLRTLLGDFPAYAELRTQAETLRLASISELLDTDSNRVDDFAIEAAGLRLDYSKHLLDRTALVTLLKLAEQANLQARIAALLAGEKVNNTEERSALHTLLRASTANGQEERYQQVMSTQEQMRSLANSLNSAAHVGYSGAVITDVVNIGIGGSDLGPRLVTQALKPFQGKVRCHYVANVDPADLQNTLSGLSAASTLFIISSKSFHTEETLANSLAARNWMLDNGANTQDLDKHFVAVTSNPEAAAGFGISERNCLPMWEWVGGRYSVWSAVGLSSAIAIGWVNFKEFLGGARAMDEHFQHAPANTNMPLLMSLLELWYTNVLGADNHVVLPYDHNLQQLPAFLQQLTMESNGKRVTADGTPLDYNTAPVLWGSAGTMGQHSFHQLLHQGTRLCPVDFVLPLTTHTGMQEQHRILIANCLAQSRTLMVGRSLQTCEDTLARRGMDAQSARQLAPHLVMLGNRPSSIISMNSLNPGTLGALLALYEHRTFCSSQLWGINPFDQWGVELGKEIGADILGRLRDSSVSGDMDAATERLISIWREAQD